MPVFAYKVLENGVRQRGSISAVNPEEAATKLRTRGAVVLDLQMTTGGTAVRVTPEARGRVERFLASHASRWLRIEQALFQLSALIRAGVPVAEALPVVADLSPLLLRRALLSTRSRVTAGEPFYSSLSKEAPFLGQVALGLVQVGEANGQLAQACHDAATGIQQFRLLRKRVLLALVYPGFVTLLAIVVGLFAFLLTIPEMIERLRIVEGFRGVQAPWQFHTFVGIYEVLSTAWPWIVGGLIGIPLAWFLLMRIEPLRRAGHHAKLHLPLFGRAFRQGTNALWTRTLGILLANGVEILTALDLVCLVVRNDYIRGELRKVRELVGMGHSLGVGVESTRLEELCPMGQSMIRVGETGGDLDENLRMASEYLQEDYVNRVDFLAELVHPVIFMIVGIIVFFVACVFWLTLWSAYQSITP